MIRYEPQSPADVLRATHIAIVTLESVTLGEWEPAPRRTEAATASMKVRVDRIFKGRLTVDEGAVGTFTTKVYRFASSRWSALPGAWSRVELTPGTAYAVFSISPKSDELEVVFGLEATFLVLTAAAALPDLERIDQSGSPAIDLSSWLAANASGRSDFTPLAAAYIASRMTEFYYANPAGFQAVLREAEQPDASAAFRRLVLLEAYQHLMAFDPAPASFVIRLLWGSIRVIATGLGESIQQPVLEVLIPNLVGLQGGLQRKPAAQLFQSAPAIRVQIEEMLEKQVSPDVPGRDRVIAWIKAG